MSISVRFDDYFGPGIGMGCWFKSKELAPLGQVRFIRGILFYAYSHDRTMRGFERTAATCWIPVDDSINWPEQMRTFWAQVVNGVLRIHLKPREPVLPPKPPELSHEQKDSPG